MVPRHGSYRQMTERAVIGIRLLLDGKDTSARPFITCLHGGTPLVEFAELKPLANRGGPPAPSICSFSWIRRI